MNFIDIIFSLIFCGFSICGFFAGFLSELACAIGWLFIFLSIIRVDFPVCAKFYEFYDFFYTQFGLNKILFNIIFFLLIAICIGSITYSLTKIIKKNDILKNVNRVLGAIFASVKVIFLTILTIGICSEMQIKHEMLNQSILKKIMPKVFAEEVKKLSITLNDKFNFAG